MISQVKALPAVNPPYHDTALSFVGSCNQLTRFALSAFHLPPLTCISAPYLLQHPRFSLIFLSIEAHLESSNKMGDEVKIDRDTFNNRLSHFVSTWKGDKRQSSDALFGGVGSIVVLLGRNEESQSFQKNNAMHVGATTKMALDVKKLTWVTAVLVTWI